MVVHHRIVEPETAGEIVGFKSIALKDAAGNIAAQATLADDIDRLALFKFIQPVPEFIHRDIHKSFYVAQVVFFRCLDVQQSRAAIFGQLLYVIQMPLFQSAFGNIQILLLVFMTLL